MPSALAVAAVLALAGCEQDGGTPCTDPGAVTGTLVATPTRQPVTSDLVVRGTIRSARSARPPSRPGPPARRDLELDRVLGMHGDQVVVMNRRATSCRA